MFKTNVDKIISQFNKMIAELDTKVSNKLKEIVQ